MKICAQNLLDCNTRYVRKQCVKREREKGRHKGPLKGLGIHLQRRLDPRSSSHIGPRSKEFLGRSSLAFSSGCCVESWQDLDHINPAPEQQSWGGGGELIFTPPPTPTPECTCKGLGGGMQKGWSLCCRRTQSTPPCSPVRNAF